VRQANEREITLDAWRCSIFSALHNGLAWYTADSSDSILAFDETTVVNTDQLSIGMYTVCKYRYAGYAALEYYHIYGR